ncbi:beta-alanine-activating enzyme [Thrips palmi]|uniref:Beta-alanine-activating enzyme n=1 Tax=Thrips palmi TaxID=161013 RepID=A0A6P8Z7Y9_THRPL|nr:beta-alanine-activating enzyme [Thrips palmi]
MTSCLFSFTAGEETLDELFSKSLHLHQDRIAVIENNGLTKCSLTYKELWDASCIVSEAIANFLKSSSQRPSQFVAVCMDQCLIYPAVLLGILNQGFGFACCDPSWTSEKQIQYLGKLGTSLLVHKSEERFSSSGNQQCRVQVRDTFMYFERLNSGNDSRKCPHQMAYAVLTSGSTGQPKIVRVPHSSIVPNIMDIMDMCNVTSTDLVFLSSPSTFDPSVVDVFVAFAAGASLLVTSKSIKASAGRLLEILFPCDASQGVSVLQMTPSVFNRWSEKELQEVVLSSKSSLRVLLFGGEPFPSESKLTRCKGIGNNTHIYNIYGITEVSAWASIHQVIPSKEAHILDPTEDKTSVPLGKPLSETLFEVRDVLTGLAIDSGCGEMFIGSSKRICEIDDENCLDYSYPVYRGTGDIVQVHSNKKMYYLGRKDNHIKRWGHRINLENVEHIALNHASVKYACSVWDEERHKLLLMVCLREPLPILTLRRHFLTSELSQSFLVPDEIIPVEEMPLTVHGKVNRQSAALASTNQKPPASKLLVKELFTKLWCEVLGLQSLEGGSFLLAGGNSLLAVILMTELEEYLGEIPKDLGDLLLSGNSFSFICEHLCQFHHTNTKTCNQPFEKEGDETTLKVDEMAELEDTKQEPQYADELESFSLRGTSSSESMSVFDIPQSVLRTIQLDLVWKVDLNKCIDASPLCLIYRSGHIGVVVGSHSGKLTYVDGKEGDVRWMVTLPDRIESSACPSVCGQFIFVGCYDGALYCINSVSGKINWSFKTGGEVKCPPALCNGGSSVLFGSYDKLVYCVNAQQGLLEWYASLASSADCKGNWLAAPLILGKIAILCNLGKLVSAVHTMDGKVIWSTSLSNPVFSTPSHFSTSLGDYVVAAEVKGTLHCLNVATGEVVWTWKAGGFIFAPLVIVPDFSCTDTHYILVGCYDFCLYCLFINPQNEISLKWKISLGARIGAAPFPFNIRTCDGVNNLCATVCNSAGEVFIVNLNDGGIHCYHNIDSEVFSSPVVYNDKIYFGCRDNSMYCLRMQS